VSSNATYVWLNQFVDSWGLGAMVLVFLVLVAWPFRPGARWHNQAAAQMIFEDESDV